jgi:GNAT superfamily N-acetyltransferase
MVRLETADAPLIERILDGTHTIWSEGLDRSDYGRWQWAQQETPWGRAHLRRAALVEGTGLVASAKTYDFEADLAGLRVNVLGIGAVYTPPASRGRGYAHRLIAALTEQAEARGVRAALLFSEIGPAFYEPMGFAVVPRDEVAFEIPAGAPSASEARRGEPRDLAAMAALSVLTRTPATLSLVRTPDFIHFGLLRRGRLAELSAPNRIAVEWWVAEAAGALSAYLIATRRPRGLVLEDCGDVDPGGAGVAMLVATVVGQPTFHPRIVHGWVPHAFRAWTRPSLWRAATTDLMMIKALGGLPRVALEGPITYWNLDLF